MQRFGAKPSEMIMRAITLNHKSLVNFASRNGGDASPKMNPDNRSTAICCRPSFHADWAKLTAREKEKGQKRKSQCRYISSTLPCSFPLHRPVKNSDVRIVVGGSRGPCHIRRIIGKRISGEIREEGLVYLFYALPFFPICVELAEGRERWRTRSK